MQHARGKITECRYWLARSEHIAEKSGRCRTRIFKHARQRIEGGSSHAIERDIAAEQMLGLLAADAGRIGGKLCERIQIVRGKIGEIVRKHAKGFRRKGQASHT